MTTEQRIDECLNNILSILHAHTRTDKTILLRRELSKLVYTPTELFLKFCQEGETNECLSLLKDISNSDVKGFGFEKACRYGQLETVKALSGALTLSRERYISAMTSACNHGRLSVAKWLYDLGYSPESPQTSFQINCKKGNLEMVDWLLEMYPIERRYDHHLPFKLACANGHLVVAKQLLPLPGCRIDIQTAYQEAIVEGHTDITEWLFEVRPSVCTALSDIDLVSLLKTVWKRKHWTMASWIVDKYPMLSKDNRLDIKCHFTNACTNGELELVKWLDGMFSVCLEYPSLTEDVFEIAVENDRLEVVKWLLTYGIKDKTIREATKQSTKTAEWLCQLFDISADSSVRFRIKLISASN